MKVWPILLLAALVLLVLLAVGATGWSAYQHVSMP